LDAVNLEAKWVDVIQWVKAARLKSHLTNAEPAGQ
jgi:hypothetical protein